MLSVQEVSTAHRFTTLSGREVFVMNGQADFELDSLIAACHDASCRPPTSGGTGGSSKGISGLTYGHGRFPLTRDVLDNATNAFISIAEPESLSGYKAHIFAENLDDMEYILRRIKPHLATDENLGGLGAKVATQSFFNLTEGVHPQHGKAVTIYFPHRDTWKADLDGLVRDMEDLPSRMHKTITGDEYAGNGVSWRFELKADPGRDLNPHEYHDWYKAAFSQEDDTIEFACHHASCRPPTSGGTGGSRPSGASGPSAAPKTKKVTHGPRVVQGDLAEPLYKPSAFGKKIRDMIEANPVLSKRKTGAELLAHMDNLKAENAAVAELELEHKLRTGQLTPSDVVRRTFDISVGYSYMDRDKDGINDNAKSLKAQIMDRIKAGEHSKYVDDPSAPVRDKIDEALRDAIVMRLASPDSEFGANFRGNLKVDDVEFTVEIRTPRARVKDMDRVHLDSETITPEYEAASTRVGKVIHDEIQSRVAQRIENVGMVFDTTLGLLREKGYDPENLETFSGFGGVLHVNWKTAAGLGRMTPEQQLEVSQLMKTMGLSGVNREFHLRNAETRAQQAAYREVMSEIVPMGGVMSGTPGHRKPTSWRKGADALSGNEQVVAATSKYPSSWTELSNHRGPVEFKQTQGRAHYQDQGISDGKRVSTVTLDGSISTAVHEIGHRYESTIPGLNTLEGIFHSRRTKNEHAVSLAKLFPGHRYGKDEQTYEDDFFDSYAGKTYSDGRFHELVTVGMEGLTMGKQGNTPKGPGKIDDEYSAFLLGALVTLVKP